MLVGAAVAAAATGSASSTTAAFRVVKKIIKNSLTLPFRCVTFAFKFFRFSKYILVLGNCSDVLAVT